MKPAQMEDRELISRYGTLMRFYESESIAHEYDSARDILIEARYLEHEMYKRMQIFKGVSHDNKG